MAQTFLKAGEDAGVVPRLDMDHPIGRQPRLRQGGSEEVGAGEAPQHRPGRPRRDPGGEQRRRRAVHRATALSPDLVQRRPRQPTARQMSVERGQTEGQRSCMAAVRNFDPADFGA